LGPFLRRGKLYSENEAKCYDHDCPSYALGKIVPYGIYGIGRDEGYMRIGQSADTAEFSVSCPKHYWKNYGLKIYGSDNPILILADCGGSNGNRCRLSKQQLQYWADEENLRIRICHYPPCCSKCNPIEHRLFPFITGALNGVMLDSAETAVVLIKKRTRLIHSELRVFVDKTDEVFEKGIKITDNYLEHCNFKFDEKLGKWNYRVFPSN